MNSMLRVLLLLLLCLKTEMVFASPTDISIVGVITGTKNQAGVVLFKQKSTGKIQASKEGELIFNQMRVETVQRQNVVLSFNNRRYEIKVGDENAREVKASGNWENETQVASNLSEVQGIERKGETLEVSKNLKEALTGSAGLNKILMQAAAVPQIQNGKMIGFLLLEIEQGSIFEVAGLKDGDVITHINAMPINDAGLAIRALSKLKNASLVTFNYLRNSAPKQLVVQVN